MRSYKYGFRKGVPLGIGYLAVAFAFGVMCTTKGLSPILATIISFTNLTSAGQYAGVEMMLNGISYFEIGLTVFLINIRYSLMSISLSQKIDSSIPTWKRLIFGFGISDETYAVAIMEHKEVTAAYMFGLITFPIIGWTGGTAIGAFCSGLFPERLLNALDIALYAMFIAIFIPNTKKEWSVLFVVLVSIAVTCLFTYVPFINQIGIGFKMIIATVIAAGIGAVLYPLKENENGL